MGPSPPIMAILIAVKAPSSGLMKPVLLLRSVLTWPGSTTLGLTFEESARNDQFGGECLDDFVTLVDRSTDDDRNTAVRL